jgi:hypothetical protein
MYQLFQRKFHLPRHQQERGCIDGIADGIDIGHQGGYGKSGKTGIPKRTQRRSPIVNDHIQEIDDKPDADQETGIPEKIPVLMRDHEIDLIDAQHDDQEIVQEAEVWTEPDDPSKNQVIGGPAKGCEKQEPQKKPAPVFKEAPSVELKRDQGPFQEGINIYDDCIALVEFLDPDKTDDLGD